MTTNIKISQYLLLVFTVCLLKIAEPASSMDLFNVRLVEKDDSRLVATSNYNYALTSPQLLTKGWRTVSVNGDQVQTVGSSGEELTRPKGELGADLAWVENLRDEISRGNTGFSTSSMSSGGGAGNFMISSSTGGTSSTYSSSSSSGAGGEMSVSTKDVNNFSVSRSDLPYNWSRILFNGDLVTLLTRNGEVRMQPLASLEAGKRAAVERIKGEVTTMQANQAKQFSDTMNHSMNMVSNIFSSIMGGMRSPFGGAGAGWPMGGGGAGAIAMAGRR